MTTQTVVADIRNVDLFDKLCDEEIEQLLSIFEEVEFSTNELIFEQGEEGLALYVIVSGDIEITIGIPNVPDESEAVVELLHAGQVFGVFRRLIVAASKILKHARIADECLPALIAIQAHELGGVLRNRPQLHTEARHRPEG